ncbi:MAG: hypothetical protein GY851_15245 [bacterium]|nr:hypothetical protein [bacterium]
MSTNQETRLLIAAKDLVRALTDEGRADDDLLPVLSSLRVELASACRALMPAATKNR